jgi:hypothetical protein
LLTRASGCKNENVSILKHNMCRSATTNNVI